MSIPLADGPPNSAPVPPHPLTLQPAPLPPTTAPAGDAALSFGVMATLAGWMVAAIVAANLLGVFRRRSILGPPRLAPQQSAWSLLFVFFLWVCAALFATAMAARLGHVSGLSGVLLTNCIAELLAFGLIVTAISWNNAGAAARLGLGSSQVLRGMAMGVGAMLILFPIVAVVSQLTGAVLQALGKPPPAPHEVLESLGETHNRWMIALDVVAAVIVAPLAEELVFRGVLQTVLGRAFAWMRSGRLAPQPMAKLPVAPLAASAVAATAPAAADAGAAPLLPLQYESVVGARTIVETPWTRWLAVILAAAVFAAIHGVAAFFPALFVLAIGLGYVYERTGNLWCTVTMHAMFNGLEIALFLSPLSR